MTAATVPTRRPPTPAQIQVEQSRILAADKARQARPPVQNLPTTVATPPPLVDAHAAHQKYLDEQGTAILPSVDFDGKAGKFERRDDGTEVSGERIFVAVADQTQVGHIKFNGEGQMPDKAVGLLYEGFIPNRAALGDTDQTQWQTGLDGQPADPWQQQMALVLQDTESGELLAYTTVKRSGRKAIAGLLKHYDRMQKTHPATYPLIQLKAGGYNHRTYGWIPTPTITVVGRVSRDGVAAPAEAAEQAELSDQIPF